MNSANDFKLRMSHWADIMEANRDYLIQLDSVVGDGDLGLTMSDGFRAASNAVAQQDQEDIGRLAYRAGKAMSTAVPPAMGTLMASGLMAAGKAVVGRKALDLEGVARGMVAQHGRAAGRGEGSRDILDPGAAVADFLMKGYAEFMMESGASEI